MKLVSKKKAKQTVQWGGRLTHEAAGRSTRTQTDSQSEEETVGFGIAEGSELCKRGWKLGDLAAAVCQGCVLFTLPGPGPVLLSCLLRYIYSVGL